MYYFLSLFLTIYLFSLASFSNFQNTQSSFALLLSIFPFLTASPKALVRRALLNLARPLLSSPQAKKIQFLYGLLDFISFPSSFARHSLALCDKGKRIVVD